MKVDVADYTDELGKVAKVTAVYGKRASKAMMLLDYLVKVLGQQLPELVDTNLTLRTRLDLLLNHLASFNIPTPELSTAVLIPIRNHIAHYNPEYFLGNFMNDWEERVDLVEVFVRELQRALRYYIKFCQDKFIVNLQQEVILEESKVFTP